MNESTNSLNWFEIPVSDISRAKKFYESIFNIELGNMEMDGMKIASFPYSGGSGKANGAIVQSENHVPSTDGSVVYLNANPNLSIVLDRIEKAGGTVAAPKMSIGENGHIAFMIDTEGNKVGLHSNE